MTAAIRAKLHDALLRLFLPSLPLHSDAPAFDAGEFAGVPYDVRVGRWSLHSDTRVELVLWPADGPRAVIIDQWVERFPDGHFSPAPYEPGTLKLPRERRGKSRH